MVYLTVYLLFLKTPPAIVKNDPNITSLKKKIMPKKPINNLSNINEHLLNLKSKWQTSSSPVYTLKAFGIFCSLFSTSQFPLTCRHLLRASVSHLACSSSSLSPWWNWEDGFFALLRLSLLVEAVLLGHQLGCCRGFVEPEMPPPPTSSTSSSSSSSPFLWSDVIAGDGLSLPRWLCDEH